MTTESVREELSLFVTRVGPKQVHVMGPPLCSIFTLDWPMHMPCLRENMLDV